MPRTRAPRPAKPAESYKHPESESLMRPEVGTQPQFKKKLPPQKYRYDDSLAPVLEWDALNAKARERGEARIVQAEAELADARAKLKVALDAAKAKDYAAAKANSEEVSTKLAEAQETVRQLKAMSRPFLNWSGKAERMSFDVPTLPLFIHERLSTQAILETLKGHKRDKQMDMAEMFGDPQHSIADQVMRAYEYPDPWVNRMILGDSLVVMNSLLRYERLGGEVQMIYIDPPYGVKFGSNFQPFVRKRDVSHNDDEDMTREPEMVQAYRDTWELRIHSYLTYLRDRLVLARQLLAASGSVFVQIGDVNVHHVREIMDEVFDAENFVSCIAFQKTGGQNPTHISNIYDTILWYAKDKKTIKSFAIYESHPTPDPSDPNYVNLELADGSVRGMTPEERRRESALPEGSRVFRYAPITSAGTSGDAVGFEFDGKNYPLPPNSHWKTHIDGMRRLAECERVLLSGRGLAYKMYWNDFAAERIANIWTDTQSGGFNDPTIYAVQTTTKVVQRCLLMTTRPGDLVLDPTCGSGTTAYVAEQWGRRWITIDTSRVPLALARQRLLTATFPWYALKDEARGPVGGFTYTRKQNNKREEVGGIVPHVTLKSIANSEPPAEEVLVDRPETDNKVTRITGRFCFEATIPTPMEIGEPSVVSSQLSANDADLNFVDRMIEVLRKSPVLRLEGNRTVTLKNVRPPAKSLSLSASADRQRHRQTRGLCLRPGERRGQRRSRLQRGERSLCQELYPSLRHRLCHSTECSPTDRELRESRGHRGHVRAGHARPHDGRPAQEHALQSGIQCLRNARSGCAQAERRQIRSRAAGHGCIRSHDHGSAAPSWRRSPCMVSRHRLQRVVLPRLASVLSQDRRLGELEESPTRRLRRIRLGPLVGHH